MGCAQSHEKRETKKKPDKRSSANPIEFAAAKDSKQPVVIVPDSLPKPSNCSLDKPTTGHDVTLVKRNHVYPAVGIPVITMVGGEGDTGKGRAPSRTVEDCSIPQRPRSFQFQPKRQWYPNFARECARPLPFDDQNPTFFGGAGSVRNLVRHYESGKFNKLSGRSSAAKGKNVYVVATGRQTCSEEPTAPGASTDSSSSSKDPELFSSKSTVKFSHNAQVCVLPAWLAAPTAPPIVPSNHFPVMALPIPIAPPPPFHIGDFLDSANFPPPPPDMLLNMQSTESEETKNDESSLVPNTDSSPQTDSATPDRGVFSPPVETYFTADGEGPIHAALHSAHSENSDRSRMGDFRAVETAVEQMANRLKLNRAANVSRRLPEEYVKVNMRQNEPIRDMESSGNPDKENRSPLDGLFQTYPVGFNGNNHGRGSRKKYVKPTNQNEKSFQRRTLAPEELVFGLQHFHHQLDQILMNGDGEVSYSRFPDPFPLYDSCTKKPAIIPRRMAAVRTPIAEPSARVSFNRTKVIPPDDQYDNSGRRLHFDSLTSCSTSDCTSSSSRLSKGKKKSSPSKRNNPGSSADGSGEVGLSFDGRSGFEFSSTISLRTSDLTKYSITQSKKEIRTGREITERFVVYGSGVTQRMIIDRPHQRRLCNEWRLDSLDGNALMENLSFDYESANSEF